MENSCDVCHLFEGFFCAKTSSKVIHPKEKIFDYSHCFQQAQHLLHPGGARAENSQIQDLGPGGSRCFPQMVAQFCSPYPESLIANLGSAVP